MNLLVAAGIGLLLAASLAAAVRRLGRRPLSLDRWRRTAEVALSAKVQPLTVSIDSLAVRSLGRSGFELRAGGVHLTDRDGHCWVSFDRLTSARPWSDLRRIRRLADLGGEIDHCRFEEATVDALAPQPPFTGLHGHLTIAGPDFVFSVDGGRWDASTVDHGTVRLSSLDRSDASAEIAFDAHGPAAAALAAIASSPIVLGAAPWKAVAGTVEAHADLRFAFASLPHLDFRIQASVDGFAVEKRAANLTLTGGRGVAVITNDSMSVEGSIRAQGVPARIRFSRERGRRRDALTVDLDDAGRLVSALTATGRLSGGRAHLDLGRDHDENSWAGRVSVHGTEVLRAPLLARLLTMASLPGLVSTLAGEGLTVDSATANVAVGAGILTAAAITISIDELRITGDVDLDLVAGTIRGEGLLIPAASLQRLVGAAPIIGAFLDGLGARHAPIVATRCTLSGATTDPRITVHPLSSLAPEILRTFGIV